MADTTRPVEPNSKPASAAAAPVGSQETPRTRTTVEQPRQLTASTLVAAPEAEGDIDLLRLPPHKRQEAMADYLSEQAILLDEIMEEMEAQEREAEAAYQPEQSEPLSEEELATLLAEIDREDEDLRFDEELGFTAEPGLSGDSDSRLPPHLRPELNGELEIQ